jgi:hypothetical protein
MSRSPFRMEEIDTIRVSYTDLFTCLLPVYRASRYLRTGLHTVADLFCTSCDASLGWTYLKAQDRDQVYKEGQYTAAIRLQFPSPHLSFTVRLNVYIFKTRSALVRILEPSKPGSEVKLILYPIFTSLACGLSISIDATLDDKVGKYILEASKTIKENNWELGS